MVQIVAYADDVIMSRNLKALKEAVQEMDNTAQEIGFIINQESPKYVRVSMKMHNHVGRWQLECIGLKGSLVFLI